MREEHSKPNESLTLLRAAVWEYSRNRTNSLEDPRMTIKGGSDEY